MAISRAQLAKELEPGLNALFGMEYDEYSGEYEELFSIEDSDRAFEEEVLIVGFGAAPTKEEGAGVSFDNAGEGLDTTSAALGPSTRLQVCDTASERQ